MAVEQYPHAWKQIPHKRHAGSELVDEEDVRLQGGEFASAAAEEEGYGEQEVHVPQDRQQDLEAAEQRGREEGGAADADVEGSCSARTKSLG